MSKQPSEKTARTGPGKKPRSRLFKIFRWLSILFLLMLLVVAGTGYAIYRYMGDDLPKIETLAEYRPPVITAVYSDDNRKIGELSSPNFRYLLVFGPITAG